MIEQALITATTGDNFACRAQSPGFRDEWMPAVNEICAGFGAPPDGGVCPPALFALPLNRGYVVVVQVAGQGEGGAGPLAFRWLVVPVDLYTELHGDLFRIGDAFPPPWREGGSLPALEWTAGPPPYRTLADVQRVIDVPNNAALLGGVQVLIDGGHLVFERAAPDEPLLRSLWMLLPDSNRCELWPATFAFGNKLGFDVVVVPRAEGPEFAHYVTEVQAGDYPEGRCKFDLERAARTEDQESIDVLFARRSRRQTMRLGLMLLALFLLLPLLNIIFGPMQGPAPTTSSKPQPAEKEKP